MKYCPKCQQTYSEAEQFCLKDNEPLSLPDPYHLVGCTLANKYRINALVGIGGMGAVYLAHQIGIDRRVAFKILQPNIALSNKHTIELFEREAKLVGNLSHENIAVVYDSGHAAEGIAYIAMEWLEGRTLEEQLTASGPLSLERISPILRQIVAALEEAHAHHIIHRDLKPSNVMLVKRLGGREQVKVLDFGIGKVISDTAGSSVSQLMGTPHYASPEQLHPRGRIDRRSDIYSLGVMLYQLLTDQLPFQASSVHELIQLHMTAPPPSLCKLRPEIPFTVEQLIHRMLAKDPDQRPQYVGEIAVLFDHALSLPQRNYSDEAAVVVSGLHAIEPPDFQSPVDQPTSGQKSVLLMIMGLLVLSVITAGFWYFYTARSEAIQRQAEHKRQQQALQARIRGMWERIAELNKWTSQASETPTVRSVRHRLDELRQRLDNVAALPPDKLADAFQACDEIDKSLREIESVSGLLSSTTTLASAIIYYQRILCSVKCRLINVT